VLELALLVESVEAVRLAGALPDWQPGAVVRLPFSKKSCCGGDTVCSHALMALDDNAMVIPRSAAWNGYPIGANAEPRTDLLFIPLANF
jgi:hypothetical protein